MKSVNFIKSHRSLALIAVLLGAMALPAFGQQDVDPTYYNPWSAPDAAQTAQSKTAQSAQSKTAMKQHQFAVRTASSKQVAKLRVKKNAKRPTQS